MEDNYLKTTTTFPYILSLIAVLFIVNDVRGQANNSIAGFVFGPDRASVADMNVELLDDLNRLRSRSRTDGSGRYMFSRLPRGRFTIRVTTLGSNFEEQSSEVEIGALSRGGAGSESVQQNFYLRIKRAARTTGQIKGVVFAQEIPKEAENVYEKAISDLDNDKREPGVSGLIRSLEIFPDYYLALVKLGEEYINLKKYGEARDTLNRAVKINGKDNRSQYSLGYASYQLKDFSGAEQAIRRSIEIEKDSVNAHLLLGTILRQTGMFDAALESLLKAKKLAFKPIPEIHWQLSLLYTNHFKKYNSAADELELFLVAKPNAEDADRIRKLIATLRSKSKEPRLR